MKRILTFAFIAALLSVPSFAAKNSQSITLATPVTVGSTKLPAGDYKISWNGATPNVQVTIEQKGAQHPVVATVPAKAMEQKHDHTQMTTSSVSGTDTLQSIQLKEVTLTFGAAAPTSGQ